MPGLYCCGPDDSCGTWKNGYDEAIPGETGVQGMAIRMMEDEHALTGIVREKYPELPYFLFGHSMGSFIARDYAAKYGAELTGVTICGTAGVFRGAGGGGGGTDLVVDSGHGDEADPSYAGKLLGWMCERCEVLLSAMNGFVLIHMFRKTMRKIRSMLLPSQR